MMSTRILFYNDSVVLSTFPEHPSTSYSWVEFSRILGMICKLIIFTVDQGTSSALWNLFRLVFWSPTVVTNSSRVSRRSALEPTRDTRWGLIPPLTHVLDLHFLILDHVCLYFFFQTLLLTVTSTSCNPNKTLCGVASV